MRFLRNHFLYILYYLVITKFITLCWTVMANVFKYNNKILRKTMEIKEKLRKNKKIQRRFLNFILIYYIMTLLRLKH